MDAKRLAGPAAAGTQMLNARRLAMAATLWLISGAFSYAAPQADALQKLAKKYSIQVQWRDVTYPIGTGHGAINGANPGVAEATAYTQLLVAEFNSYPRSLIAKTGLRRIVLSKNLAFKRQLRAAIPNFEQHTLYLDCLRGQASRKYQRAVIHHEFFHMIDLIDDGQLYKDDAWSRLNAPDFRYGPGGAKVQNDGAQSLLTDHTPGFLTKYATTGVEEDKAELFAHMMVNPQIVAQRQASDPALNRKVIAMKALLRRVTADMNEDFWRAIQPE